MIVHVFVYRRRTVRELVLTGGKVNGKHKGAVLVHGYVDLANQRVWLSFKDKFQGHYLNYCLGIYSPVTNLF
jgi:hypothetical protein